MCSTRGAWLPGDERGFRSSRHKIHSSGDYRTPPPREEHAGLREYSRAIARAAIILPEDVREVIAGAVAEKFAELGCVVSIVAVSATHVHALVGVGAHDAKRLMGWAKQFASHRVRERAPGKIWGQGCHVVRVRDEGHAQAIFSYIQAHGPRERAGVWVNPDLHFAQVRRQRVGDTS